MKIAKYLVIFFVLLSPIPCVAIASELGIGAIAGVSGAGVVMTGSLALPVAGAAEVVGILYCFFADPPDTINARVPVDINDFKGHQFPSLATIDPSLNPQVVTAAGNFTAVMDQALANIRAEAASVDRYQGALLLGDSASATARLAEANSFRSSSDMLMLESRPLFQNFVTIGDRFGALGDLSQIVKPADVSNVLNEHAAGVFPSFETLALASYGITPEEILRISQAAGRVSDNDIENLFRRIHPNFSIGIPARDLLTGGFNIGCEECARAHAPEPSTLLLLGSGLAGLGGFAWRRRRNRRDNASLIFSTHRADSPKERNRGTGYFSVASRLLSSVS